MRRSRLSPFICIKPNAAPLVKPTLSSRGVWKAAVWTFIRVFLIGSMIQPIYAQDDLLLPPPLTTQEENTPLPPAALPGQETVQDSPPVPPTPQQAAPSPNPAEPKATDLNLLPLPHPANPVETHSPEEPLSAKSLELKDQLPPIQARTFPLKVLKRSTSSQLYLFDDNSNSQPPLGSLLLLKSEDESIMALRVLKLYPNEKMVAAKRVKKYGNHNPLEKNDSFVAVEKISDIIPPPPTVQDNSDLKELEAKQKILPPVVVTPPPPSPVPVPSPMPIPALVTPPSPTPTPTPTPTIEVPPPPAPEPKKTHIPIKGATANAYDSELDEATTPRGGLDSDEDEENLDPHQAATIEESTLMDRDHHWLTVGFGYVRNNGPAGGSYYFSSGNVRYSLIISKLPYFNSPHLQDSLALETGLYFYKTLNYSTSGDAYSVFAFPATIRYNLFFSEGFGMFLYGGVMISSAVGGSNGTAEAAAALSNIAPAGGAGFLFQLGPHWYTRVEFGIEAVIGINLTLKF